MASLGTQAAYEGDKILTCKSKEGLLLETFAKFRYSSSFLSVQVCQFRNAGSSKMARLAK
jgi:hypothetical protein